MAAPKAITCFATWLDTSEEEQVIAGGVYHDSMQRVSGSLTPLLSNDSAFLENSQDLVLVVFVWWVGVYVSVKRPLNIVCPSPSPPLSPPRSRSWSSLCAPRR